MTCGPQLISQPINHILSAKIGALVNWPGSVMIHKVIRTEEEMDMAIEDLIGFGMGPHNQPFPIRANTIDEEYAPITYFVLDTEYWTPMITMNGCKMYVNLPVSIKETLVIIPTLSAQEDEKAFFVRYHQLSTVFGAAYCFDLLYIIKDLIYNARIAKPDYTAYKPKPTIMPYALKRFLTNQKGLFLTFYEWAEQKAIYNTFEVALGPTRDVVWGQYGPHMDYNRSMDIQLLSRLPQELMTQFGYQDDVNIIPALQICGEILLEAKMSDKALIAMNLPEEAQMDKGEVMGLPILSEVQEILDTVHMRQTYPSKRRPKGKGGYLWQEVGCGYVKQFEQMYKAASEVAYWKVKEVLRAKSMYPWFFVLDRFTSMEIGQGLTNQFANKRSQQQEYDRDHRLQRTEEITKYAAYDAILTIQVGAALTGIMPFIPLSVGQDGTYTGLINDWNRFANDMRLFLSIPAFAMLRPETKIPPFYMKDAQYLWLINALHLQGAAAQTLVNLQGAQSYQARTLSSEWAYTKEVMTGFWKFVVDHSGTTTFPCAQVAARWNWWREVVPIFNRLKSTSQISKQKQGLM